jgi:predicted nucleic acid-binding Zn ribbon protein
MSSTVLRLGLWLLILTLGLFIFISNVDETPLGELITPTLLQHVLVLSVVLVAAGGLWRIFEKTANRVVVKNRCQVCGTPVPHGAIYCRTHLRGVLEAEDRRTHSGTTRVPKV